MKEGKRPEKLVQRLICLVISIIGMGLGVGLMLEIGFGSDSFATVNQGIIRHVPIMFGTSEIIMNGALLIFVLFTDRKQINIGTVLNMCCIGYIADFFMWTFDMVLPAGIFEETTVRYAMLLPTLMIFVFSCAGYMAAELGVSAYDAIPVYLEKKITKIPGRLIRMMWDFFFIISGWLMGATVGIITILMAFMLGPVIAGVKNYFKKKWYGISN